jgi:hypothetical protein
MQNVSTMRDRFTVNATLDLMVMEKFALVRSSAINVTQLEMVIYGIAFFFAFNMIPCVIYHSKISIQF